MLSKKRAIIISAVIAAVVLTAAVVLSVSAFKMEPEISVMGSSQQTLEVFSPYTVSSVNATSKFLGFRVEIPVVSTGQVDTNKIGSYTIKHTATVFGKKTEAVQTVSVVDTTPPVITVKDQEIKIELKNYPIDPNLINVDYSAMDNLDGDITERVVKETENNILRLTVSDSSGNKTTKEIKLVINDSVRPTLVLSGPSVVYVAAGGSYSEPGYSATDNKDGNITAKVQVTGSVDTQHSGAYYKYYTVTDTAGNTAKVTRKIVVYGGNTASDYEDVKPSGKTIYLTFDDGPGAYTNQLLGYLDKYGVKATFFVTNQFPKYQYLIKTAHQQGHKIAIHTASHKWSIYKTPENYMQDFNAMQDIVTAQTGSATNIFRFPGGTNNTISRSQNKGIMTLLSKQMTDSGYFYFDWNVDSNDARYSSTQKIISDTISQISTKTNAVVLMHDIKKYSVEAVPAIIEYGLENGYTFKVLDENSPAIRFKPAN